MTKAEIIAELYSSQEMADALAKMKPEDLREDLRQEIFVALCEMEDSRIIAMHTNRQLKFFAVRIMLNMIQSKTSRFFYKFRRGGMTRTTRHMIKQRMSRNVKRLFQRDTRRYVMSWEQCIGIRGSYSGYT